MGHGGRSYPGGEWEPIRPQHRAGEPGGLPNQRAFAVGTYYLAQTLAMSLAMGEVMLDDAASFYDGLVVQRAMDAARRSHQQGTWVTTLTIQRNLAIMLKRFPSGQISSAIPLIR